MTQQFTQLANRLDTGMEAADFVNACDMRERETRRQKMLAAGVEEVARTVGAINAGAIAAVGRYGGRAFNTGVGTLGKVAAVIFPGGVVRQGITGFVGTHCDVQVGIETFLGVKKMKDENEE